MGKEERDERPEPEDRPETERLKKENEREILWNEKFAGMNPREIIESLIEKCRRK